MGNLHSVHLYITISLKLYYQHSFDFLMLHGFVFDKLYLAVFIKLLSINRLNINNALYFGCSSISDLSNVAITTSCRVRCIQSYIWVLLGLLLDFYGLRYLMLHITAISCLFGLTHSTLNQVDLFHNTVILSAIISLQKSFYWLNSVHVQIQWVLLFS